MTEDQPGRSQTTDKTTLEQHHQGTCTKRVRMVRDGVIGITLTLDGTEYAMPIHEALELVNMINRVRHDHE